MLTIMSALNLPINSKKGHIMKKNLIPIIGLGLLVTACGGGGGGGGSVSNITPTLPVVPTPIEGSIPLETIADDLTQSRIPGIAGNFTADIQAAHAEGYTGAGFKVFSGDPDATSAIAPDSRSYDIEDLAGVISQDVADEVNPDDAFTGAVVSKDADNDYIVVDRSIAYTDENGNIGNSNISAYEAGATAVIWDKFDSVSGSALSSHIDATRNTNGSLNVARALSPTELTDN